MKVLNIIWGFSLGAGIDKCFLTYDGLASVDSSMEVVSVCINLTNLHSHIEPLVKRNVTIIDIKGRSDFSWIKKLSVLVNRVEPDILFSHGFNGAILLMLLKIFGRIRKPFVCTYHGSYHAPSKSRRILEPLFNGLPIFIYKHIAKHTICVENFSKCFLQSKGVKRVSTVHNGIPDLDNVQPKNSTSETIPLLITASRITEVKGLIYLLKALSILKKRGTKFHYNMIGEGPLLPELKNDAHALGLNKDDISFLGYSDDVPSYLSRCDLFLLPSLFEYHSIAVLEAMRSSCAIIATNVGGNSESITHEKEGLIIPSKDPVALADAIQYLLEHPDVRANLARNARLRFENEFTEDAMKRGIIQVLKL